MWAFYIVLLIIICKVGAWLWGKVNAVKPMAEDVILITGGCMGLGRQVALLYAASKCTIVIWDVAVDQFPRVSMEIQKAGGNPVCIRCDVSKSEEVAKALEQTLKEVKQIDILINNAGIVCGKTFFDMTEAEIRKTLDVNTFGSLWVLRAVYATGQLKHVTQICSVAAFAGSESSSEYTGAKHAITGFMRSIRLELKRKNSPLTTTCIYPWLINTGFTTGITIPPAINFIWPFLDEPYVGKVIYNSTCERREEVIIPKTMSIVPLLGHLLPTWLFDKICLNSGEDSMKNFVGRNKKSS